MLTILRTYIFEKDEILLTQQATNVAAVFISFVSHTLTFFAII